MKTARRPWSGIERSSSACASPSPIQATPRTVTATETVSDCRVSEKPLSTNATSTVATKPAVIQGTPPSSAPSSVSTVPAKPASTTGRSGRVIR